MICEDGKCDYDTLDKKPLPVPDSVPSLYGNLFTLDEYRQLVANSRLPDTHRQAVLQLVSQPGAKADVIVCPVAIKPDEPEWIYALVIFPESHPRVSLSDIKVGTLKRWKLVRHDDWQPEGETIEEYAESARMFFF